MKYIVEYKSAGTWLKVKQVERRKNGTSCCKVIKFDNVEETEFTVNKYKNLGYEVRVIERA